MEAQLTDASETKLSDLTPTGKAVSKRVGSAAQAQEIVMRFIRDDTIRASRRLMVQGAFNGNAPKTTAAMIAAKRLGDSNLNWKEHRGHIMNAWTPYFDLVCEVPVCIDADLDIGDPAQSEEMMRGIAEYFHDLVFGWRHFDDMNQLSDLQMLLHGCGALVWQDEWTWHPIPILANNFYIPAETMASLDNCEMMMITQPINAGQLYRKIEDEKAAKLAGWNPEVVKNVIMDSANSDAMQEYARLWDRWEQAFKNGDLYVSQQQTKQIKLATLFVQEMDGTISQMIVPQRQGGNLTKSTDGIDFLYYAQSKYANWDEATCLFMYDIGADGTFHSAKGLGTDIFPYCELLNKVKNALADLLVTGIKPMWQPATAGDISKFEMVKWGGGNLVPMGFNQVDMKIGANLSAALEITKEFTETLTRNTGSFNQQDVAAPSVDETAKSALIRASERSKITKGSTNRYMRAKSRQYAEMFRRATRPDLRSHHPASSRPLQFQRKCKQLAKRLGIPWELYKDAEDSPTGQAGNFTILELVENVRANQPLGMGSPAMRIEIANQLMQNIDRFDEIGQNEIKRMWVACMTNFQGVDAIVPSLTNGRQNVDDQSDAADEDNGFSILGPDAEAFVTPDQNHVIHLSVHVPSMQNDQQQFQQGAIGMRECAKRSEGKAAHSAQHLAALKRNPTRKKEYTQFAQALGEIGSFQDRLEQMITQQNQAQAQQAPPQQPDPELVKVHGKLQLKAQQDQGNHELKMQAQQFQQQLAAQQQAFDTALKKMEAEAKIERENALAVSKARNGQQAAIFG